MTELWDLFDENRNKVNKTMIRGQAMPEDLYHVVVHVWIKNEAGRILLTQRAADSYRSPLKWECTCGSVLAGETSLNAALREVKEEVGISLKENKGKRIDSFRRDIVNGKRLNDFVDVYFFKAEEDYSLENATTSEVNDCKWIEIETIAEKLRNKEMIQTQSYILDLLSELKKY